MATSEQIAAELVRVSRHELRQSLTKIEKALSRIPDEQAWERAHDDENAIGNLLLHLAGNLRQWIISGIGGEPDERDRPSEFARRDALPVRDLLNRLRAAVDEADRVLETITPEALLAGYRIQVYDVTGAEAVLHVITHFAEHTGQILWAVKRAAGEGLGFYAHLDPQEGSSGRT
jgi:uncharacterized damage-inducible protein DinB